MVSVDDSLIQYRSTSNAVFDLDFDVHGETDAMLRHIEFTRAASGTVTVVGFRMRDKKVWGTQECIRAGANITTLRLVDTDISFHDIGNTPANGVFGSAGGNIIVTGGKIVSPGLDVSGAAMDCDLIFTTAYDGALIGGGSPRVHDIGSHVVRYEGDHRFTDPVQFQDAVTAPTAVANIAKIYVDNADGDLKVKFGDNVTKVIAADT